jgi:hypothetical protein
MLRQAVNTVTLIALVNLTFAGCSKVVNIKLDEVAVDTPKRITGVVTKSGEDVTFDDKGGKYEPVHRLINGTDVHGVPFIGSLKELDSVRVIVRAEDSLSPFSISARHLPEYLRPLKADEIVNVRTLGGTTHRFWDGGRVNLLNRQILGLSITRSSLMIPFDSVAYVGVKRPDVLKSSLLTVGLVTVITVLIVVSDVSLLGTWDCDDCQRWQN